MKYSALTRRRGFSLMEIILALAILAGGLAVLGELLRLANRNAVAARDLSYAQLLCESKMNELKAGLAEPAPVTGAVFETDPDWQYSVELTPTDEQGLVALRVTVSQGLSPQLQPLSMSLLTWIPDPGIEPPAEETEEAAGASSAQSAQAAGGGQ